MIDAEDVLARQRKERMAQLAEILHANSENEILQAFLEWNLLMIYQMRADADEQPDPRLLTLNQGGIAVLKEQRRLILKASAEPEHQAAPRAPLDPLAGY